jgi:hypothetical protein
VPSSLPAAALPKLVGDLRRVAAVRSVEVDVVGDQELAGAHGRRPGGRIELGRAVVGDPRGVGQLRFQALVLASAHAGEVAALGPGGRLLVEINRDAQLLPDAPTDLTGDRGALLHRHSRDGDKGDDVGGTETRMRAVVLPHIDKLGGTLHRPERRLADRLGRADEGDDGAVRVGARVHVQ